MPLSPKQEKELAQLNKKSNLVDRAKRKFGVTSNCQEAGFILENGAMLDFTGRKKGNTSGIHIHEHEDVSDILKPANQLFPSEAIAFFQKQANAIRFGCRQYPDKTKNALYVQIEAKQKPTEQQLNRITQCCKLFEPGYMAVDIYEGGFMGKRMHSESTDNPNCLMIAQKLKSDLEKAKKKEKK